ncbi:MAG: class I SAM-dependent methyltransferase [Burkholderiales bacterium]
MTTIHSPETEQLASQHPSYGTSDHYLGEKGASYFAWQGGGGLFGGRINAHKFADLVRPDSTVLDFGCGGGFLLKNLHCHRRLGVEINPAARQHAATLGIECYATTHDVPDGIVDLVITDHALEHVPYPIGALEDLRKKIKPGGRLALCVPINNWREDRIYNPEDQNHHLHTWTPQLMGNTLAEAGFVVDSVYARIFAWPGRWTVACYGRLPYSWFKAICFTYGWFTGKGWEILAVARPR